MSKNRIMGPRYALDTASRKGLAGSDTAQRPLSGHPAGKNRRRAVENSPSRAIFILIPAPGKIGALTGGSPLSTTVPSAEVPAATTAESSDQLLARILASLDDDKAEDIVTIDLRGRSAMADHMVIASGRSSRQVASIAQKLADRLKTECGRIARIEGKDTGDWVLIDTDDVIVHVFRPEVREFYQLEKMWMPADSLATLRSGVAPDAAQSLTQ